MAYCLSGVNAKTHEAAGMKRLGVLKNLLGEALKSADASNEKDSFGLPIYRVAGEVVQVESEHRLPPPCVSLRESRSVDLLDRRLRRLSPTAAGSEKRNKADCECIANIA